MGSFMGHAVPATFFTLYGAWLVLRIFQRYFRLGPGAEYRATGTFPPRLPRWPYLNLEALVICVFCALGIVVETVGAYWLHGQALGMNNKQHATMYAAFGAAFLVIMLLPRVKVIPPKVQQDAEFVALLLGVLVEALLFKFHLYGRQGYDVLAHIMLLYAAYACVLALVVEMWLRTHVLASLARAYAALLQGTWLWQLSFLLYSPLGTNFWGLKALPTYAPEEEHHTNMKIVLIFAWHVTGLFLAIFVTGALIGCRYGGTRERVPDKHAMRVSLPMQSSRQVLLEAEATLNEDDF